MIWLSCTEVVSFSTLLHIHRLFQSVICIFKKERKRQRDTYWRGCLLTSCLGLWAAFRFSFLVFFIFYFFSPRKSTQILLVQFLLPSHCPNQDGTFLLLEGLLCASSHLYKLYIKCLQGACSLEFHSSTVLQCQELQKHTLPFPSQSLAARNRNMRQARKKLCN